METAGDSGSGESGVYRVIFDNLPFIAFTLDRKGKVLEGNRYTARLLGMRIEDARGKAFSEVASLGKKDLVKAFIEFRKNLGGNVTDKTVYKARLKGGREMFLELVGIPLKEKGRVTRVLIVGSDITEHERMEKEIEESEESYRQMVELSPDGIVTADLKGIVTSCNEAFVRLSGFGKEEILGKHFSNLPTLMKKEMPRYVKLFASLLKGGRIEPFEFRWVSKKGETRLGEIKVGILKKGGKISGFQAVMRDITERKESEESIRESEEKLRMIFDNVNDVIIYVDRTGKIIDVNRKVEDVLGYKPEEVIGKNFAKTGALALKDIPKIVKMFMESVSKGQVFGKGTTNIMEIELRHKDGRPVIMESSTRMVKEDGRVVGFLNVLRDVTDRRKSETEVRGQAEELEKFNRLAVGRELKMVELKKRIAELEEKLRNR